MHLADARNILKALADGFDPGTGEELPKNSPIQDRQVVRVLYTVLAELQESPPRKPRDLPTRAGQGWTKEEDAQLLAAFDGGATIEQLAAEHERTRGAVTSRLTRLGRIQPQKETEGGV